VVFFRNEWRTKKKNKYVPRQINDRVIGFPRADKRDFVKAGVNTMNYIYIYNMYDNVYTQTRRWCGIVVLQE
jgi:hypothetical protein